MMLKTERCTISELEIVDFGESVRLFTDKQVRQFLGGALTQEAALEKLNSQIYSKTGLYLSVRISESGAFVGIISITDHHDKEFMELSYQFLPEFWGKGIAEESVRATLVFLKRNSAIKDLIAETQIGNIRSCRLLEKLGFGFEKNIIRFGEKQSIYKLVL